MAYGGGTFLVQNKVLPGAYFNFVSKASASATLSDRGTASMPLILDWGPDGEIFTVEQEDFQKKSMQLFGYDYTAEELKGLRDLFLNCQTLHAYKLTSAGGVKAANNFAVAKYTGKRGNELTVIIQINVDDESKFDVTTKLGTSIVDEQTVASASELKDNDYLNWKSDLELAVTAGEPLTGGVTGDIDNSAYQTYIDKAEAFTFNTCGVVTSNDDIKSLFATWVERMRDEVGKKFQLVVYQYTKPDYMGVISVKNPVTDDGWDESSLVYWVTGLEAACQVNKSCQNTAYDGDFTVSADYTQTELKNAIGDGEWVMHRVDDKIRVLDDINTMVTTSDDCGDIFKDNQTVRVIDQIANDIANIFVTKYLGFVPNDKAGRVSLWSDIVKIHQQLNDIRAIEDFEDSDITVEQGDTKKAVVVTDYITVVNAMSKLYMTVTVA